MLTKSRKSARRANQALSYIPRAPKWTSDSRQNPIATRLVTHLKYSDIVSVNIPSGPGFTDYLFNLNSLFDPNRTGTGHQPKGFDQLAALYTRYRVYQTKAQVSLIVSSFDVAPTKVVIAPSNSVTNFSTITDAEEAFGSRSAWTTIYNVPVVSIVVNLPELNGKTREAYAADDTTQALVTSNPSETLILHCCSFNTTGSAQTVYLDVTMEFYAEFSDPVQLGQS
jgi:hypothetical protein